MTTIVTGSPGRRDRPDVRLLVSSRGSSLAAAAAARNIANNDSQQMLIDANRLGDDTEIRSDVTVVGAGPAGIVMALELAAGGLDVALVDSGGTRYSKAAQQLGDTPHLDPRRHAPMSECTRRQLGGATVIWGGRCLPFDPVDFDEREFVPHSRWPVTYDELRPFFQRTCDYFVCGRSEFDLHRIEGVEQTSIVPRLPDAEVLTSSLERWSLPTNFGREYGSDLERSDRIKVYTGLTCTEIETDASGSRVAALHGKSLAGKPVTLRSSRYVLSCGTLETTRLLLASDRRHPGGIGNHSDHLGRYYMGHISGRAARVRFTTPPRETVFGFDRDTDGVYLRRRFSFAREFLHEQRLTNVVAWLVNPEIGDPSHRNGMLSFAYLALSSRLGKYFASDAIRKAAIGEGRPAAMAHLANMLRDPFRTLAFMPTFGYKRFVARRKIPGFFIYSSSNTYMLHYHGEQVPNPQSRVSLADDTDRLGLRRLKIDLRFLPQDVDGIVRAHRHWDAFLRRHGRGSLEYVVDDVEGHVRDNAADGFHQAGTTRMSREPADGVVTPDCNVHGFEDLFVNSGSIFVTSGQANSTFMILVFALRLADHLKRLASRGGRR